MNRLFPFPKYATFCLLCFIFYSLAALSIANNATWEQFSGLQITSIEYSCDGNFNRERVHSATVIQVGDTYSRSKIRKSIEQIYSLRDFSRIKVDAEIVRSGIKLKFILTKQIKTGDIKLLGNDKIGNSEIAKVMKLKPGYRGLEYDEAIAQADVESIGKLYKSSGFYNTRVSFAPRINHRKKEAEITFGIVEGKQPIIREIILLGTNEAIVRTEDILKSMRQIKRGKAYEGQRTMELDAKNIERIYRERGFITASIGDARAVSDPEIAQKYRSRGVSFLAENHEDISPENSIYIIIEIQSGMKVDVEIRLAKEDGETEEDEDSGKNIAIYRMNSTSEPVLRKSAEEIQNIYKLQGYYLAEVDYELLRDKNWIFSNANDAEKWEPMANSSLIYQPDGMLKVYLPDGILRVSALDNAPKIQNQEIRIYAEKYRKFQIRMKADEGSTGRLHWVANKAKEDYIDFDIIPDGKFHNYEIDMRLLKITGSSLKNLRREGIPDDVLQKLKELEDEKIMGTQGFINAVGAKIGADQMTRYKAKILKYTVKRKYENWSGEITNLRFGLEDAAYMDIAWIKVKMTEESIPVIFTVTRNRLMKIKTEISITNTEGQEPQIGMEGIKKQMLTRKKHLLAFWPLKKVLPDGIFSEAVLDTDLRSIIAFYKDLGYSQAKIVHKEIDTDLEKGEISVSITIYEGPKTAVTDISLESDSENILDYDEIKSHLPSFQDQIVAIKDQDSHSVSYKIESTKAFRSDDTVTDRSYLRSRYADEGYFAQIEAIDKVNDSYTEAAITYRITMGNRIRLDDDIDIIGNFRTRDYIIRREISKTLTEEKVFNRAKVMKSWQRLLDLGFLAGVKISTEPVGGSDELHKMIIDITERDAISANMHLGSDSTAAFRAGLEASHINLFGTGRRANGRVQVGTEGTSLKFGYVEPRFLGTRAQGLVDAYRYSKFVEYEDANNETKRYTEKWTGGSGGISHRFNRINTLMYGYRYDVVDYVDIHDGSDKSARIGSIETTFQRDTRKNPMNPTSGWLNAITLEYASKWLQGDETFVKAILSSMYFTPISQNAVMALGLRTGYIWMLGDTERVLTPKKFILSDYTTPRGFRWTVSDAGDFMLNMSMEIRFPIYSKVDAAVFFDSGYVSDKLSDNYTEFMNSSVGLGLRFITPIGPIRLDYGYPVYGNGQRNKWPHIAFGHAF